MRNRVLGGGTEEYVNLSFDVNNDFSRFRIYKIRVEWQIDGEEGDRQTVRQGL